MSPYAEYPKNPRSQDWGREAIEMHENGSTKNLLQMTDVYYSVRIPLPGAAQARVPSDDSLWTVFGGKDATSQLRVKENGGMSLLFT